MDNIEKLPNILLKSYYLKSYFLNLPIYSNEIIEINGKH